MDTRVLAVNSGSSSVKCSVFEVGPRGARRVETSEVTGIGTDHTQLRYSGEKSSVGALDHTRSFSVAVDAVLGDATPDVVSHRVVHGGPDHAEAAIVTDDLIGELLGHTALAPLHMPINVGCMQASVKQFPSVLQVACFDTSFHRTMPMVAQRTSFPSELFDKGVRRYGFHGLSYEYVVRKVGASVLGRAVIAHLGSGSSLAAVDHGVSIDTTMGFTPAAGVPMGTRTGDVDPGIIVYLLHQGLVTPETLERLVNNQSGLLGVSGQTSDMQTLLASDDEQCKAAVDMYCYEVTKRIGAFSAVLGGLDTLVFTGGIGENSSIIRERILARLRYLGVVVDETANAVNAPIISKPNSATVRVVPAGEDEMLALHGYEKVRTLS